MIAQVRPGELNAWLAQVRGAQAPLVIDVREPHELATASIGPGDYDFVAIPMNSVAQRLADRRQRARRQLLRRLLEVRASHANGAAADNGQGHVDFVHFGEQIGRAHV